MNYDTCYNGNDTASPKPKAKKTALPIGRIHPMDGKTQRRGRDQKGQTAVRPCLNAPHAFLRTAFLPRLEETEFVQDSNKMVITERDFYKSLSHLSEHYGMEIIPTQSLSYPMNVAMALRDAEEKLKSKVKEFGKIRLLKDEEKTYLTIEEHYDTGACLYYIPVVPLYRMLNDSKHRASAILLLSVCTYLYHIADIPYYRQEDSYLFWQYDILKDWIMQDEPEENADYMGEIDQAEMIGTYMEKKIFNLSNLTYFEKRLTSFKAKDLIDWDCLKVAEKAFHLYQQYPNETVFRNISTNEELEEEEQDEMVAMDRYVSFYADSKGWLSEQLEQMINNELQEYGELEEPALIKKFDGNPITEGSLDFEKRLFALMEELAFLLNHY
ncbi:hypothetical protein SAMN05421841_1817 [Chryseobacterium wanjuense]|uniref:PRTRC system protein F n=1 Tax=Chryseobacterium wanjuense TaxID=356305 RepID=A0A1I0QD74_9FLAO|nr:hypothetical protein [Chryseobacterium wanjuense]SEW24770.1 hypothetical protein SAMN05421841_1817 [Chryseobacterium wanjuense]